MGWQSFVGSIISGTRRGTNQGPWRQPRKFDKTVALSSTNLGCVQGANPVPLAALIAAGLVEGSGLSSNANDASATSAVVIQLGPSDLLELMFFATTWVAPTATAPGAGKLANAYLFLVYEAGQAGPVGGVSSITRYVGKLALTSGANPLTTPAAPLGSAVDLIAVTEDYTISPGIRLTGKPSSGGPMAVAFDHGGAVQAIVAFEPSVIDTTYWGLLAREY